VGYEAVRRRRPDIVYTSVSCYGYDGPWGGRRGYEVQGQAVAGAQVQFGGTGMAARLPYEINDYGTGIMGGFATALALFHRARTGLGQRGEAALAYTATLHQSLYLHDHEGKSWDEPSGPQALGTGPLHRLYRAADGWFFLGAEARDLPHLRAVPGLRDLPDADDDALAAALEHRFAAAPADAWIRHLQAAGLGAHKLCPVDDVMRDPWAEARGLSLTREHPGIGLVRTIGPVPRLSRTPVVPGRPAPLPGADGDAIRAELGLGVQPAVPASAV
jgi:crotonobetainyl-CoA:carnitine CoA-transferase CaiB-like acyl-CoA transferase